MFITVLDATENLWQVRRTKLTNKSVIVLFYMVKGRLSSLLC